MFKKIMVTALLVVGFVYAGGIVTNANQSADYIRTLNRNASTDLDAVYFNPAGLSKLSDGFHLYLSNQTITQTRTVKAEYQNLNEQEYEGNTFAPAFPNIYFAYKKDRLVLSGGLAPVGGGGSAEYPTGLPDFEYKLAGFKDWDASMLNSALAPFGTITGYDIDASFEGSSIYIGFQGGVTFALNDNVSVAGGLRFVSANNTYLGGLTDLKLYTDAGPGEINASHDDLFADKEVDAARTGSGITPIIGLNLSLGDKFNMGIKYEHKTELTLVNETKKDDVDLFPNGEEVEADMPALLGIGYSYQLSPSLRTEISFNYYLNSSTGWMKDDSKNGLETGLSAEYSINQKLAVSAGYLKSILGAEDTYHSGMSNAPDADSFGFGLKYALGTNSALSLGVLSSSYADAYNDEYNNAALKPNRGETYGKSSAAFAIGYQHSF